MLLETQNQKVVKSALKELPALREVNLFGCSLIIPAGIALLKQKKDLVVSK